MASNNVVPPSSAEQAGLEPKPIVPSVASVMDELLVLRSQLDMALQEISSLKHAQGDLPTEQVSELSLEKMPPVQALEVLKKDPVAFVQELMERSAQKHLWNLKEEAELQGALNVARKVHPEFEQFESFIMQEVIQLIQNDPDGVIDPWHKLLEKGLENFKQKFKETLKRNPETLLPEGDKIEPGVFMEGKSNRIKPELLSSFSREQIAKMSLDEFLKNEAAINEALKNNRIK